MEKPLRWSVVYSSFLATRPPIRSHDGYLYLRPKARWLVLIDGEGSAVDARFLKVNEIVRFGSVIQMPCHHITVGGRDLDLPEPCIRPQAQVSPQAVPKLDLCPGLDIQHMIWRQFFCPVAFSPASSPKEFFMVASFGRSVLHLDPFHVSHMLQACLGGIAEDFSVILLRDRTYRFSVNNQQVGFFVHNLSHFKCSEFVVYFALWGNGGPNFVRELRQWEVEESQSWSIVGPKSFADVLRQPLSGANLVPLGTSIREKARTAPVPPRPLAAMKVPFLHKLTEEAKDDLEAVISAGYDYSQVLHCFRFDHEDLPVSSHLDSLSPVQLQELRALIALQLSEIQLAAVFRGNSGGIAPQTTVPVSSAFNRVITSFPPSSGNSGVQTAPTAGPPQAFSDVQPRARTSAFDRLQAPASAHNLDTARTTAPRVSAFERLQLPASRSDQDGPP
ncbi:hypothetical protein ACQ4PT_066234 [Festuca glaucescens]